VLLLLLLSLLLSSLLLLLLLSLLLLLLIETRIIYTCSRTSCTFCKNSWEREQENF